MTELQIYNSQGTKIGTEQPEVSTRIEQFFFGGIRLYVEADRDVELTAFFRARESKASRAEQYYAVYRTDTLNQLFDRFITELTEEIEDTHGMSIQTTSDDVQVFAGLTTEHTAPGSPSEHTYISELLSEGKQLQFGVSSVDDALGLFQKYLEGKATRVAIAENASNDELADCDLVIELGSYDGLEPIGDTETYMSNKQRQATESSRPRAGGSLSTSQSESSKLKQIGMPIAVAVGTFVALLVLVLIGANGAAVGGVGVPSFLDPVVFVES